MRYGYGKNRGFAVSLKEAAAQWVMSLPEMREALLDAAKSMDPESTFDGEAMGMEAIGQWLIRDNGLIDRAQAMCCADPFLAFVKPEYDTYWRRQAFIEAGRFLNGTPWWRENSLRFRRAVRNRKILEGVMDD